MSVEGVVMFAMGATCVAFGVASGVVLFTARMPDVTGCERVVGRVEGPSPISYVGHHTAVCSYEVGGRSYLVEGPLFLWGSAVSGETGGGLTSRDDLPLVLPVPVAGMGQWPAGTAGESAYEHSVIGRLYPVGSAVDIWYDQRDPERAFVERPCPRHALACVLCLSLLAVSLVNLMWLRAAFRAFGI